ncbi:hypothetical protein FB451DRAFT_1553845 [Mycena latifolia]|nr:hypothetical protein FB451DRAFT_1553845 [Mycena latifolia]
MCAHTPHLPSAAGSEDKTRAELRALQLAAVERDAQIARLGVQLQHALDDIEHARAEAGQARGWRVHVRGQKRAEQQPRAVMSELEPRPKLLRPVAPNVIARTRDRDARKRIKLDSESVPAPRLWQDTPHPVGDPETGNRERAQGGRDADADIHTEADAEADVGPGPGGADGAFSFGSAPPLRAIFLLLLARCFPASLAFGLITYALPSSLLFAPSFAAVPFKIVSNHARTEPARAPTPTGGRVPVGDVPAPTGGRAAPSEVFHLCSFVVSFVVSFAFARSFPCTPIVWSLCLI